MVGDRCRIEGPRRWRAVRRALAVAVVAAALVPGAASAAGPDDLAQTIDQNLAGIEFRVEFSPERSAHELNEQKRQLRMLESEAPDHPMIPELTQRVEQIEAQITEMLGDEPAEVGLPTGAPPPPGLVGPVEAPVEVTDRLREVERWLSEAEAGLLQGQPEAAAEHLDRADELMAALEREYADQIPAGHVPLIVATERLASLKEQVDLAR